MEHLLFAAYLILFAWLVTRIKFFSNSGLSNSQIIILFLLKVMAGIIYGWIGVYYGEMAQMIDTWAYHYQSIAEYHLLLSHPIDFFTSLFHNTYKSGYTNFLFSHNSWWNDLKGNFYLKIVAIFDVFSFGNYYVNVIFYSFLSLFGPVAIFRVMKDVFPTKKIAVLLASFLIPSFLYWTSGLHKEGIIFLSIALIVYHFYFGLKEKRFSFLRITTIIFYFLLILALRNFLIVTLVPALLAWFISSRVKFKPIFIYAGVFSLFLLLFFTGKYISPNLDFVNAVVVKQEEFSNLGGQSAVKVTIVQPSFISFVMNAPQAFSLSALRPYPSDVRHLLSLAAAMEVSFLYILFVAFLMWPKNGTKLSPFLLFCLFFSFSVLMMIGYTVNILGAIVRYRSIVLPFLIVPMVAKIDWSKISRFIFGNIKNDDNV